MPRAVRDTRGMDSIFQGLLVVASLYAGFICLSRLVRAICITARDFSA
jgi:hypothetical protein